MAAQRNLLRRVNNLYIAVQPAVGQLLVVIDRVTRQVHPVGMYHLRAVKQLRLLGLGVVQAVGGVDRCLLLIQHLGRTHQLRHVRLGVVQQRIGIHREPRIDQMHAVAERCMFVVRRVLSPARGQDVQIIHDLSAGEVIRYVVRPVVVQTVGGQHRLVVDEPHVLP